MTSARPNLQLAPEIRATLVGVRWRIRAYILLEGLLTALLWVGVAFWITLALDYLPILVGASELPRGVRGVLLVGTVAGAAGWIYWLVVRRLLVRLSDRSMALLLERRYRDFGDSLLTAVEMAGTPGHADIFHEGMLERTTAAAAGRITHVGLTPLFNWRPLAWRGVAVLALVLGFLGFGLWSNEAFSRAAHRLWLLGTEPWPRRSQIEVVGIEVQRSDAAAGDSDAPILLPFVNGRIKVARGASFNLRVLADAGKPVVPEICSIRYWTTDGEFGLVRMKKIGRVRAEEQERGKRSVQWYAFDGKPFKGILSSLQFDVLGNDHRVGQYVVDVVDSPVVVETQLDCVYPDYLVDEATSSWLPRTIDYLPSGTQLPRGTRLLIRGTANKPLQRVVVRNLDTQEETRINVTGDDESARRFEYPVAGLLGNLSLEVILLDRDQVFTEKPFRIAVSAIPDDAPRVETRLAGIGTAVTPDVVVPTRGKITDDYQVKRSWIEVRVGEGEPREQPLDLSPDGQLTAALDFRELRSGVPPMELKPQDKLRLRVVAQDQFRLGEEGPNLGMGELYELDVVPPEELLRQLEGRELALRRRFEQIIEEVTELRDSLLRVKVELAAADPAAEAAPAGGAGAGNAGAAKSGPGAGSTEAGAEPGEGTSDGLTPAQRARSLRILRVQRAQQQTQKSSQEVLGVAMSFAEIREELINNRVDTEDRKDRLQEQIAEPLQRVVAERFPELERRLAILDQRFQEMSAAGDESSAAAQEADTLLAELQAVLQNMLDLETYNELLDIVRDLLKEQAELLERTRQQQKKQLRDLSQ